MSRYAGIRNDRIYMVSNQSFASKNLACLEIPSELDYVSASELVENYRVKDNKFRSKYAKRCAKDLRVAFVGNFKMACGISTYNEHLWPEIIKHIGDYKLFVEKNNDSTGPLNVIGTQTVPTDKILSCWQRGESLKELITAIKEYNPDIISIGHEFGLWPSARDWLSLMNQLSNYRIITTMHSIFHHQDKTICEAAIPEIIVHLQGAYDVLKYEKNISGKVYVVPHGCYALDSNSKLWNIYKSDHTFIQLGFGFRYKNFEDSIHATAILKKKYSDIFFSGIFSESLTNKMEHQLYYDELMSLVDQYNLQENVSIIRGFQSDTVIDSYLRTNKVAIFPYKSVKEHEVFGSSGAARLAMSKNIPVITSSIPHFGELPTIKVNTADELAHELDTLFSNAQLVSSQVEKQRQYIEENSWEKIALRYVSIFENPPIT